MHADVVTERLVRMQKAEGSFAERRTAACAEKQNTKMSNYNDDGSKSRSLPPGPCSHDPQTWAVALSVRVQLEACASRRYRQADLLPVTLFQRPPRPVVGLQTSTSRKRVCNFRTSSMHSPQRGHPSLPTNFWDVVVSDVVDVHSYRHAGFEFSSFARTKKIARESQGAPDLYVGSSPTHLRE